MDEIIGNGALEFLSACDGGGCVEVAFAVAVRDSKSADRPSAVHRSRGPARLRGRWERLKAELLRRPDPAPPSDGAVLWFNATEWKEFLAGVKAGRFDLN